MQATNQVLISGSTSITYTIDPGVYMSGYKISPDLLGSGLFTAAAAKFLLSDGTELTCGNYDASLEYTNADIEVGDCTYAVVGFHTVNLDLFTFPSLTEIYPIVTNLDNYSTTQVQEFLSQSSSSSSGGSSSVNPRDLVGTLPATL